MRRFGLIGKTLKHSFSQNYFAKKFAAEQITDCRYDLYELMTIDSLPDLLRRHPDLQGLNVTIPYKEQVIPYLDATDSVVSDIGACNCIRIREGRREGFNTDAPAFQMTLQNRLRPHHRGALVLGSGGASRAIQYALRRIGMEYRVVSRQKKPAEFGYEELTHEVIKNHQVIINTTPVGMYPDVQACPPLPYEALTPQHLLYDLVYNPARTLFLSKGEQQGAETMNGYDMLVLQAEESWRIWNS